MLRIARFGILVLALCGTALADSVTEWDSATPLDAANGIFPIGGAGQVNGNFQVNAATVPQVGVRFNRRFSPVPLPTVGDRYFIETGESGPGLPLWNYDLHIDLRGTGLTFADFDSIDVAASWPNHSSDLTTLLPGNTQLFQTSQNPGFFASGIDPFLQTDYTLSLTLRRPGMPELAVDARLTVNADGQPSDPIPEPGTLGLLALGGAVGLYIRRRRRA